MLYYIWCNNIAFIINIKKVFFFIKYQFSHEINIEQIEHRARWSNIMLVAMYVLI